MLHYSSRFAVVIAVLTIFGVAVTSTAVLSGSFGGYVVDPMGVGLYEMAVNCNDYGNSTWGGAYWTPPSGWFSFYGTPGTVHSIIADDHLGWGTTHGLNLADNVFNHKIYAQATYFQYAPTWDMTWHRGVAQTFVADGSCILKVTVRIASPSASFVVSVHKDGPTGPQIGPSRTISAGSSGAQTAVWQPGEVPTTPGEMYCVKVVRSDGQSFSIFLVDPLVDNGDACPEGCLWWFDGSSWKPDWDWDTGILIVSDSAELLCNLNTGKWGKWGTRMVGASTYGQTFVARGTGLVSASFTVDTSGNYVVSVYNYDGTIGSQVGTSKVLAAQAYRESNGVVWSPGEFPPLVPGNTYYIEIKRQDLAAFGIYRTNDDVYSGGTLFVNRIAQPAYDLASTIYVESKSGEATKRQVRIADGYPQVSGGIIFWVTDVPSDTKVEYAVGRPPYTHTYYSSAKTTYHTFPMTNYSLNTVYHFRVSSGAPYYRRAVSRDFVLVTSPSCDNLLSNPGFETGSLSPWVSWSGNVQVHHGEWFWNMPPRGGNAAQFAQNGGPYPTTGIYQRVRVTPGKWYRAVGWFALFPTERINDKDYLKYDVFGDSFSRLMQARIGLDPAGGTSGTAPTIIWSRNAYSFPNPNVFQGNTAANFRYICLSTMAQASSEYMTLFTAVDAGGSLSWNCWSVDDFVLQEIRSVDLRSAKLATDTEVLINDVIVTAVPDQVGSYYVENQSRTCGIRVESVDSAAIGNKVTVIGGIATNPNGERVVKNARILSAAASTPLCPVGMSCASVGGSDCLGLYDVGQRGVSGGIGPNNIGLLVRVWGRVQSVQDESGNTVYYINDGSLPEHGLKLDLHGLNPPPNNSFALITGISACESSGTSLTRLLVPRTQADIQLF
ncbi:MAG: hypothetical protein QHI38_04100 [Armatimonadota bacterium]|nr:hypothetical protein [Armatimonadota bacterium]